MHCENYASKKSQLFTDMELFIISKQGLSLMVVLWPLERQGSLRNMVLTAVGTMQSSTSLVGDVLENGGHEPELVWMPQPCPGPGW